MIIEGELRLKVDPSGGLVTLRSEHKFRWFGAVFAAIPLLILAFLANGSSVSGGAFVFELLVGLLLAGVGLFLMVPRSVSAVFDLRSRRFDHHLSIGPWRRERSFPFEEVAGLGLKQYSNGARFSYMPMLFLASGASFALSTANGSALSYQTVLADTCQATGLARRDVV